MNAAMVGVIVSEHCYGRTFVGTREALVAAGVVDDSKFPGDPGNPKSTVRYQDGDREVTVRKRYRSAKFEVLRRTTAEEEDACRAATAAARELEKLPGSEHAFRAEAKARAETFAVALHQLVSKGSGGYRFDSASVRELISASVNLVNVIAESHVVLDRPAREREIAAIKARASSADPTFRRFLRAVISSG
jgi:hypothetical protein